MTSSSGSRRPRWSEPSNVIAAIAALIAFVALASSVRSCQVSEQALALSQADFLANRALILRGDLNKDKDAFSLHPIDSAFVLQTVHFAFPNELGESSRPRPSLPPDFLMYIPSELIGLRKFIDRTVPRKPGTVSISLEASVPFVVEASAVTKGGVVKDRSIYALVFTFTSSGDNPTELPAIEPRGISFVRRLTPDEKSDVVLEAIWQEATAMRAGTGRQPSQR